MRVFVAINPPEELKRWLHASARELREADFPIRWVSREAIHLTLKFLGEVAEQRIDEIADALREGLAEAAPFEARATGFGAFPSARRPNVVWVGVEAGSALELAQQSVEQALVGLGFEEEKRAFRPHMTLGRARRGAGPQQFRGLEEALGRLAGEAAFRVGMVDVMLSKLKPSGAEYTALRRIELASPGGGRGGGGGRGDA